MPQRLHKSSFFTLIHVSPPPISESRISNYLISPHDPIRSSSLRGTNIYKLQNSLPYLSCQPMGGFADKYPKGAEYSKSSKHPKGKPDLNGFCSTIRNAPRVGVELESNCSRTTVNKAKIRPPQTLCTFKAEGAESSYRREGAERSLRSINQHFLPPFTDPRPRFPNIKLSNLSITIKPRLTIVDSFYGYYRSLQEKQIYEIF
jgi:hypothetical protein